MITNILIIPLCFTGGYLFADWVFDLSHTHEINHKMVLVSFCFMLGVFVSNLI